MRILLIFMALLIANTAYGACDRTYMSDCLTEQPKKNTGITIDLNTVLGAIAIAQEIKKQSEVVVTTPKTTTPKPVKVVKPAPIKVVKPTKPTKIAKLSNPVPKMLTALAPPPRPIAEIVPKLKWDHNNRLAHMDDYLIEGQYLISLKYDVTSNSDDQKNRRQLAAMLDIPSYAIGEIFSNLLAGFVLHASPEVAAKLKEHELVKSISQDMVLTSFEKSTPVTIPKRVKMDTQNSRSEETHDVIVYVIDTGIREDHVEISQKLNTWRGVGSGMGGVAENACNNHGTAMASLIAGETTGQAGKVKLTDVTIASCPNRFLKTQSMPMNGVNLITALEWIAAEEAARMEDANWRPAVVNMSFGAPASWVYDLTNPSLITDGVYEEALRNFIDDTGAIVVAAAGNDGEDACKIFPAHMPEVITVGALQENGQIASFSNEGPCVNAFAKGENQIAADASNKATKQSIEGTSGAAAIVSGVIAHRLAMGEDADTLKAAIIDYPITQAQEIAHIKEWSETRLSKN